MIHHVLLIANVISILYIYCIVFCYKSWLKLSGSIDEKAS